MKIMVTGGAGFIGSHVVDLFIEQGHEVVVVDDLSTGRKSNLNPNAKFYLLDIRDPALREVFEKEKPEVISHHAAQMDVRRSVDDPILDADINILGSIKLAQLAVEFRVRKFIYISSGGAVYGEPNYLPCDEEHPVKPLCPYGASKYTFEMYLYMFKQIYDLNYSILRYPNVYGPRQDPHGEAGVVAIFIGKMLRGEQVTINGSGEQVRDFVYVTDCAKANLLCLDKGDGEMFNLGSGIGTSVNQIFTELKSLIDYPIEPIHAPPKAGETFRIYLSPAKANRLLGWHQEVQLAEGLKKTIEFFQAVELRNDL